MNYTIGHHIALWECNINCENEPVNRLHEKKNIYNLKQRCFISNQTNEMIYAKIDYCDWILVFFYILFFFLFCMHLANKMREQFNIGALCSWLAHSGSESCFFSLYFCPEIIRRWTQHIHHIFIRVYVVVNHIFLQVYFEITSKMHQQPERTCKCYCSCKI